MTDRFEKQGVLAHLPPLRRRQFLAGAAALSALGAAGVPLRAGAAPSGNLRVMANANPSSLDPATGGAGSDHVFLYCFYDTLVDWDFATLAPQPGLAESWEFTDPQTLVFKLREGVSFHDGTPFDAAAVVFNLERNRSAALSNIKKDLGSVESVEATGAHEVTLRLSAPDTALPLILSDRAGMMISPAALGNDPEAKVDREPVGTGPWKFTGWTDGEKVTGEANPDHWRDGIPKVESIELQIIPERATALRAAQSGQADIAYQIAEQQKVLIERMPTLALAFGPTLYVYQLYLNASRGPLSDPRIRKAMTMAIDRDAWVKATQAGVGEPAHMNLPKAHWAWSEAAAKHTQYDLDMARSLMKEAGVEGGFELDFRGYTDQASVQRSEVMLEQLGKLNITGRFTNGTIAETSSRFFSAEKAGDVLLSAWTGRPDPSLTYSLLYSESSYYNPGRVAPPEGFEAAMADSRASADQAKRAEALGRAQELVMDAALTIPLSIRYEVDALSTKVQGYSANLLGKPKFLHVGLG
ncbi:ABC transporter substrate-binding protein [Albimonas sp. CAU 1670]|uniref:ABC transporter substrate-binding protein n=1 Tax=Albimonas sp. CAU 1670 TaxID=3032599 RepID=UPI0023DB3661|nr:ABC transporter substrate-binding protein [Albimonas sp. CAU 1670]MDF2233638.1 ABC transporter substrate-binding protein [Albimonas sp. CAU 1670]